MADPTPPSIVRASAWQALVRRLDAAIERDGRLIEARDAVLRPVELLRAMMADAPGSLGDDVLVADRLRAMLFLAWPYAAVTLEARALLDASAAAASGDAELVARLFARLSAGGSPASIWPPEQPAEPGVIDHAALLVLMLAAARVADPPFAPVFLATVHGIALSASAAEVLARLDPRQPDAPSMRIVLETLYLIDAARTATRNEFLRPFAFDPVERGRWRCLEALFQTGPLVKAAGALGSAWDGATSHEILKIAPRGAAQGETVLVTVARSGASNRNGDNPLRNSEVVFASPGGPLIPAKAKLIDISTTTPGPKTLELEVTVPAGAVPGWIGFSRANLITTSNNRRAEIRTALSEQLGEPCVEGASPYDVTRVVPDYGTRATPRRRAHNRFDGGDPVVLFAGVTPVEALPGERAALSWETAGADHVTVTAGGATVLDPGLPSGKVAIVATPTDDDLALVVTPISTRNGAVVRGQARTVTLAVRAPIGIGAVDVTQGGGPPRLEGRALDVAVRLVGARGLADGALIVDGTGAPPIPPGGTAQPGHLTFVVPPALVSDGMTLTITATDRAGQSASRTVGPFTLRTVRRATLVLARPAVVSLDGRRVDAADAQRVLTAIADSLGLTLSIVDLPFCDDELAVMVDPPSGDGDPALLRILEGLARRALLTPRFEEALWLALVPPNRDQRAIARSVSAYAARALAVATPAGIERLLRDVFLSGTTSAAAVAGAPAAAIAVPPSVASATGPHLAILGTLDVLDVGIGASDDDLRIEEVRVDQRRSGPGAPIATKLEIVTVAANGRELDRRPVRVLSTVRPIQLAVLVPVGGDVAAVELRRRGRTIKAFRRTRGALSIEVQPASADAPRTTLDWQWHHTHNARPHVSLLLKRGELLTPAHNIDPCHTHAELPLWRFAGADQLALYASDGWNTDVKPIGEDALVNDATAVVRALSDGRFYADVPSDWEVIWRLNGQQRATNQRTLRLGADDMGVLEIEARSGDAVIRDTREVRPGEGR